MIKRIRNARHALFARNPTITVEVIDGTWNCEWDRMSAEEAVDLMRGISDAVDDRQFSHVACSATVH